MKTLAFFIPTFLVLFSFLINVVIAQNYFMTCEDSYTLSGSIMAYTGCYDNNAQLISGSINLGGCIGTYKGHLEQMIKLVYQIQRLILLQYDILKDTL